jgi:hypothetical protein
VRLCADGGAITPAVYIKDDLRWQAPSAAMMSSMWSIVDIDMMMFIVLGSKILLFFKIILPAAVGAAGLLCENRVLKN